MGDTAPLTREEQLDALHALARECAADLEKPDRKQLRYNEIVASALRYYPSDPEAGVREIVASCDRANGALYVRGAPMHGAAMERAWGWAFPDPEEALR